MLQDTLVKVLQKFTEWEMMGYFLIWKNYIHDFFLLPVSLQTHWKVKIKEQLQPNQAEQSLISDKRFQQLKILQGHPYSW